MEHQYNGGGDDTGTCDEHAPYRRHDSFLGFVLIFVVLLWAAVAIGAFLKWQS